MALVYVIWYVFVTLMRKNILLSSYFFEELYIITFTFTLIWKKWRSVPENRYSFKSKLLTITCVRVPFIDWNAPNGCILCLERNPHYGFSRLFFTYFFWLTYDLWSRYFLGLSSTADLSSEIIKKLFWPLWCFAFT